MQYKNIINQYRDEICYLTINRPEQLNTLNKETILELNRAIIDADNNKLIKCIILTGAGERAFVAGADIKEFASFTPSQGRELAEQGQELLFDLLETVGTPSIAAINGFALGGGLELAMAAHIRIASDSAKMGLPEVSLGIIPGYGGTQRLANLVGKGKAIEMISTASMLTAVEAKEWGLVNYVCPNEDLILAAEKIASKIKKNSPMAIAKAIKSINSGFINNLDGFEVEKEEFGNCFGTPEFIEGTVSFMEKRKPNF
ncbi:MAG: enoyl-CoA hydratase [Flavobacteriales bacterium]|nr:enoyl-CoA hydratase [Flavobacteriales bacterium]